MWGTVIMDAYRDGERQDVANALDDLCDPHSSYGFASGGTYCFWNFTTREVLYIGRARDLGDRFKQHNALKGSGARGNKREDIKAYFTANDLLGYSILVRDPGAQGIVASSLSGIQDPLLREVLREDSLPGDLEINDAEGIAIRSELLAQSALPAWNRIAGSDPAWRPRLTRQDDTGSLFTGTVDVLLQARRTLRELSGDPTAETFEERLHTARADAARDTILRNVQISDEDVLHALDRVADRQRRFRDNAYGEDVERIRTSGYLLSKAWPVSAEPVDLRLQQRTAWTARQTIQPGPAPPPLNNPKGP